MFVLWNNLSLPFIWINDSNPEHCEMVAEGKGHVFISLSPPLMIFPMYFLWHPATCQGWCKAVYKALGWWMFHCHPQVGFVMAPKEELFFVESCAGLFWSMSLDNNGSFCAHWIWLSYHKLNSSSLFVYVLIDFAFIWNVNILWTRGFKNTSMKKI